MHVHASFLSLVAMGFQLIIFGFIWRTVAFWLCQTGAGKTIGEAMLFVY